MVGRFIDRGLAREFATRRNRSDAWEKVLAKPTDAHKGTASCARYFLSTTQGPALVWLRK